MTSTLPVACPCPKQLIILVDAPSPSFHHFLVPPVDTENSMPYEAISVPDNE